MEATQMNDFINELLGNIVDPNLALPDPTLVEYYDNLKNRTYWLDSEIDANTLDLVGKIIHWNREDAGIPVDRRKPIKIFFNSPGGSLDVAETLCSIIKISKTPVYGIALGWVCSGASLMYLVCHKRFALSNAYWVFHRGSIENIGGNFNEVQAAMKDYKEQIEKLEDFYIKYTNFPEEMIREKIKSDWYIHEQEALDNGVVEEIIEDIDIFL